MIACWLFAVAEELNSGFVNLFCDYPKFERTKIWMIVTVRNMILLKFWISLC